MTAREEKFCQEYVKRLNKTQSAIAAGYSKRTAKEIGYENFTKPHIQTRINDIRQEIKEKLGIDEHSILTELASLAFWNIKDFISGNNAIKDLSKLRKDKLKPVIGIVTKNATTTFEGGERTETRTELKLADKRGALVDLGRHLGIFEEDNKQAAAKITVTRK